MFTNYYYFANSIKSSRIQKMFFILEKVQKFVKLSKNLKNVHEFRKNVHHFIKLRVIMYLGDATKCGHGH